MVLDQFGKEVKVGDYVMHKLPGKSDLFICSKILALKGTTQVLVDLGQPTNFIRDPPTEEYPHGLVKPDAWEPITYSRFVGVTEDFGKEHYELSFVAEYKFNRYEFYKRISIET
jgi:hypothetical protein